MSITSLGFRGEALPSIAAVSRLSLISCPPGAAGGFKVVAQAGEIIEASPWAAPPGTQVEVAELFFNTPARQKFLKSPEAEQAQILGSLRHLALGYPQVHFSLSTPTRTVLTAPAAAISGGTGGRGLEPGTRGPYAPPVFFPGGLAGDGSGDGA